MQIDVLAEGARAGQSGTRAALATVLATGGSTPRHPGAKMVIYEDGRAVGTVGGGRIELDVTETGRAVAAGAPAARVVRHLVRDLAMCCGGRMEVWVEPLDAARWKPLAEALRRRGQRLPCALVTALSGGGGKDVLSEDESLRTRRPRLEDERFVEPILPAERLVLFGAGHVARALAALAARVGFEIVVCDEDESYASAERFPGARLLPTFDVNEVARDLAPLGAGDYAIIVTREHAIDQRILEALLPRAELSYLGLIGSRGKLGRFRRRLEAKGLTDPAVWDRLHCPVGLDIGAETPDEIAVAVAAELVRARHACAPQP